MALSIKDTIVRSGLSNLLYQQARFEYDSVVKIYLPDSVILDNLSLLAVDNNNLGFVNYRREGALTFTAGAVAYGEASRDSNLYHSNMTDRISLICGDYDDSSDLYGPTSDGYSTPISVEIIGTDTGHQYYNGKIYLWPNKDSDQWTFTSGEAVMVLDKGVTKEPNSRGRMGDLNLLALIFIFYSAGLNVDILEGSDSHIKKSFRTRKFFGSHWKPIYDLKRQN